MHVIQRLLLVLSFLALSNVVHSQWINEIHYDNSGTDANEGVGIIAPSGTDLSCYSIELYNQAGTNYDTEVLSGIVGDEGCGYGEIWFDIPGIQNGPNDGIALVYNNSGSCTDATSIIQLLSYQGTFTGDSGTTADGQTSIDIGVYQNEAPLNTSLQLTGSGTSYADFSWTFNTASSYDAINGAQSISPCNTITTEDINGVSIGASFTVDCNLPLSDNGTIEFSATGTYNSGNTFTAELSDINGSFDSPTVIGSLSSTSVSGSIPITIPSNAPAGSYTIRIISDNPSTTGSDSEVFTINQSTPCDVVPFMKSVIINSCSLGGCSEGNNEIIFGNTGSYSVEINPTNFEVTYDNTDSNQDYTSSLVTNSSTTSDLNSDANCSTIFFEGTNETLPPNSSFMLVSDNICTGALDWTSLCSSGPIYVIYSTDPSWGANGNFANDAGATSIRYFKTSIIDTYGMSHEIDYNYDADDLTLHQDGDYILFDTDGGLASTYGNNGCTIDPVVLSSEVTDFKGEYKNKQITLNWKSITEFNNDYFTIFHSIDGFEWNSIGDTPGHGNSISELYYGMIHDRPESGLNYYQLHSTDFDGTTYNKATIAVNTDISFAYFNITNNTIELEKETDLEIYSTDGRLVYKNAEAKNVSIETKGMFILVDLKTNQTERIMVH